MVNNGGTPLDVVQRMVECWRVTYPKMVTRFNSNAPKAITITIDPNYGGVAAAGGTRVTVGASNLNSHPKDVDLVTHEVMHLVQAYTGNTPGWAVEGLADYSRYRYGLYNGEGGWSLPNYSSSQNYTDSYRVTARFFVWLENKKRSSFPVELNAKLRSGTYTDSWWNSVLGKSVGQLWSEYGANPAL